MDAQDRLARHNSLARQADKLRERADSYLIPVLIHTVTEADVGQPHPLGGGYLACDVGKRVYLDCGTVQIENNDQLAARLAKRTR